MAQTIDVRGKTISTYIAYHAAEALRDMQVGNVLDLHTDDTEAIDHDLRVWCETAGHRIVATERNGQGSHYRIEKQAREEGAPAHRRSLAMVISDAGLEELLSPLGFALAAALGGTEVSIYFQGPAVRVVTRGFTPRLHGWRRPLSRFARQGLSRAGHVDPQEKLTELRRLGAHLYACGPSMNHFGLGREDLLYDDIVVAEYLTFIEIMQQADIQLFIQ